MARSAHSRGRGEKTANANVDNRANQLNPNNPAYWQARGHDHRTGDVTPGASRDRQNPPDTESSRQ